jgi:putative membrane protein
VRFHFQQAVRALILLVFSTLLFKLHFTGEITKFINPKYEALSQIASIVFLILFLIQITRIWTVEEHSHQYCDHEDHDCSHHHDHGDSPINMKKLISYLIIAVPLITGFLLPPKVLDASIADKKGAMLILSSQKQTSIADETAEKPIEANNINELEEGTSDVIHGESLVLENQLEMSNEEYEQLKQKLEQSPSIMMNDSVFAAYYDEINMDIEKFKGREIQLKGFVYKEDGLEQDQLVISRFLITHCVADASIIGFLSELPEAASIQEDSWIEVNGVLDITTSNGIELPIIKISDWKIIGEPNEPYLYPITIRLL